MNKGKQWKPVTLAVVTGTVLVLGILGHAAFGKSEATTGAQPYQLPEILGLEDANTYVPADNPLTAKKVELGRLLFFDKRLSKNNTVACVSCHLPDKGFGDGKTVSTGVDKQKGTRSAPISVNRVYGQSQFWDGRAATLEDQSIGPFVNPVEHGFLNHDEMVAKMRKIRGYRTMFKEVFGRDIVIEDVGRAIASFQRTILSGTVRPTDLTTAATKRPCPRRRSEGLSYSAARRAAFDAIPTSTFPMKSSITSASGGIRTPWTWAAIW